MNAAAERFKRKTVLSRAGCLLWTGTKNNSGYGKFKFRGEMMLAHRVAWEFANGSPPPAHKAVCHTCDVRSCVNPEHLFLATNIQNIADRVAKGRSRGRFSKTILVGNQIDRHVMRPAP